MLVMTELNLAKSPVSAAKDLVLSAYNYDKKNRRNYLRVLQQILRLAEKRGYSQMEVFAAYFRNVDMQTHQATEKLLRNLFEFVSPDEILQMMKIGKL